MRGVTLLKPPFRKARVRSSSRQGRGRRSSRKTATAPPSKGAYRGAVGGSDEVAREDGVAFAERLLALLDEGSFATTYKYALLLALIDCCLEHADGSGRPPASLTPRQLAERVLVLYWPHTVPFPRASEPQVLRQSGTGQAEIVTLIHRFRTNSTPGQGAATLAEARWLSPDGFERLVCDIEWKLVEMPFPRLQKVGNSLVPFLYEMAWDETVRRRDYAGGSVDGVIRLAPGAGENLVRLAGLIRPLVHRLWAERVAKYNRRIIEDAQLEEFLFSAQRLATVRLRAGLTELQDGRCFYTGAPLDAPGEIDHVLPWARYPNNAIENLVVASRRANGDKRAFLVAPDHLRRWRARNESSSDLAALATAARWETRPAETDSVARAIYLGLPEGVQLWVEGKTFVPARRRELDQLLR